MYGTISSKWKIEGGKFHWHVVIPPNTTATVHIPTKDAAIVTEGGKPANEADGVRFLRAELQAAVY
jgi:alpha-L-rhamnosidase